MAMMRFTRISVKDTQFRFRLTRPHTAPDGRIKRGF